MSYKGDLISIYKSFKDALELFPKGTYFIMKEIKNVLLAEVLPKEVKARMRISEEGSLNYICEIGLNHIRPVYKCLGASVFLIKGISNNELGASILGIYLIGDLVYDIVEQKKTEFSKPIIESSSTIGVEASYTLYRNIKKYLNRARKITNSSYK